MFFKFLFLLGLLISFNLNAENLEIKDPAEFGVSQLDIDNLFNLSFEDESTQSVVLLKNGYLIGERYADGFNKDSYGTSWSMAKSYYAALILISIDRGEIKSLDEKASNYLPFFDDERSVITIRQLLNMSSGLQYPDHQHETMFFRKDHLEYSRNVKLEKEPDTLFEYNNVNSMLLGEILEVATGKKADILLEERILNKIGVEQKTLWRDEAQNVLTYCCIDMSARDYSKLGLLFARDGKWNDEQIVSKEFVDETFQVVWETPSRFTDYKRYYSLHWWVSKYDEESKIFNTSGKFGQHTFVDRENDIVVTRISKYAEQDNGSTQKWGIMKYLRWAGIDNAIAIGRMLIASGTIESGSDVITPFTEEDGESYEFYVKYPEIIDSIADLSRN